MSQYLQLGQAAVQQKNFEQAIQWFGKALAEQPKNPQIIACLGQSFCWQGQVDEGILHLRQSGQLLLKKARKTRDADLALDLVEQLQYWGDYPGALEICKQAAQINQRAERSFQLLALCHARLNQKKAALLAGRQALKLEPDSAILAILLASLEVGAGQVEDARCRLDKVLQKPLLNPEQKFRAHKEQARVLDKLGDYQQVFAHLHAAARIALQLPEVNRQDMDLVPNMLEINKAEFDRELLGRWSGSVFPAEKPAPVFLLGFMRTGTTLTQEVLGAHPDIFVADETDLIRSAANELSRMSSGKGNMPEQLRKLDLDGVLHLRNFYWARVGMLYGDKIGKRLFVDKTTMNTIDAGLINCLFPDAKLLFLIRDPRDVCLSCIMQTMQPNPSTVHLIDWQHTARFYSQVMDWWMTVKPRLTMDYLEFRYEDAVCQFEPTFSKVFDFLGLNWDASVVDFHKNAAGKYIASPSFEQVAQPLYSSSVGRWKRYAEQYADIDQYLQPYLAAFGYEWH